MNPLDLLVLLATTPQPSSPFASGDALVALLGVLVSSAIGLAAVVYTQRTTKKLKAEDVKRAERESKRVEAGVEALAYERARTSYEASIARYEADLSRLSEEVGSCRKEIQWAEGRIDQLEDAMREHNFPVPAPLPR